MDKPHQHASFLRQEPSQRLKVKITLAPSCASCELEICKLPLEPRMKVQKLDPLSILEHQTQNQTRRPEHETLLTGNKRKAPPADACIGNVGNDDASSRNNANLGTNENHELLIETKGVDEADAKVKVKAKDEIVVPPSMLTMPDAEIMKRISKAIPAIRNDPASLPAIVADSQGYLIKPIGSEVASYTRKVKSQRKQFTPVSATMGLSTSNRSKVLPETEMETETEQKEAAFIITLANGKSPGVNEYHQQVQKLALFFIENADDVDLTSDEGGGEWSVLYLFRSHAFHSNPGAQDRQEREQEQQQQKWEQVGYRYSLAGYMTLFTFYSPFKKPKSGNVLRICQAMVLPPYQRQGHGKAMMRAVYDYAKGSYNDILGFVDGSNHVNVVAGNGGLNIGINNGDSTVQEIVEVNVEDPAPGFTYMRDRVDYQLFETMLSDQNPSSSNSNDISIHTVTEKYVNVKDYCFPGMTESDAVTLASKARITKTQIQIAYEIYKLARMTACINKAIDIAEKGQLQGCLEQKEEAEKKYRLMVKKRLNGLHKEEIGACPSKVEKQAMLSKLFEEALKKYKSILRIS
jgi:GNAT superfamily N-acetyltransferase